MATSLTDTWTEGIEYILEEIRLNSVSMSEYHKERYFYSKGHLKYFRIPLIILAGMNSVFSVGLQPYCPQQTISLICCLISLVCGIISSVELFLSIQQTMENELIASKDFYLLSVEIFKTLALERSTRMTNGKSYLDETYQVYCKLIENSNIVSASMRNMLDTRCSIHLSPKSITNSARSFSFDEERNDINIGQSMKLKYKRLSHLKGDNRENSIVQEVKQRSPNNMIQDILKDDVERQEEEEGKDDEEEDEAEADALDIKERSLHTPS